MSDITTLREHITTIDQHILELLKERENVVKRIGEYKRAHDLPIIDAVREASIMADIPETYQPLWDEMMDVSKRIQYDGNQSRKIAIQGVHGSFNEIVLRDYLERSHQTAEIIYTKNTATVIEMVSRGEVEYGQFALMNSTGGLVSETLESLGSKRWKYITHYKSQRAPCAHDP